MLLAGSHKSFERQPSFLPYTHTSQTPLISIFYFHYCTVPQTLLAANIINNGRIKTHTIAVLLIIFNHEFVHLLVRTIQWIVIVRISDFFPFLPEMQSFKIIWVRKSVCLQNWCMFMSKYPSLNKKRKKLKFHSGVNRKRHKKVLIKSESTT